MTVLQIDLETFSSVDLIKCGVYRYVEAPDFEILLFGYAYDDEPVRVIDLTAFEDLPDEVLNALTDPRVTKTAYNANFERACISKHFGIECDPHQWICTAVWALALGLPGNLAGVAEVLKLDAQKDIKGKNLIKYFSVPCKPSKANGERTRNYPHYGPEKWEEYKAYNYQDVVVEREVRRKLERFPIPEHEWRLWALDQQINDRGVRLDQVLFRKAIACSELYETRLVQEAQELTGLDNPNSLAQIKEWLADRGLNTPDGLSKEYMPVLLDAAPDDETRRMLELRKEMSKTSVDKYNAMDRSMCADERARGLLQFCGANRTGRWCLTGDHELLTTSGWKRLDEWEGGEIACWSPQTEYISFQKANLVSFDYTGEMISISHQRCEQISTPDHKMPFLQKDGTWGADTLEILARHRFTIPFTGRRLIGQSFEPNKLRVLIMTQADGHYTHEGDVRYHFKKERKIERCKHLLRKCQIPFIVSERSNGTAYITVKCRCMPIWLRQFQDKTFGYWVLDESPDVIFDELPLWDGCACGPNSIQYSTGNKQNAEVIQAAAVLSGRSATLIERNRDNEKWNCSYVLNIWNNPGHGTSIRIEQVKRLKYSGKVYCAETKTGYFLVRRNGKVWVTGNSGRLIQVQNLPQNKFADLALARETLRSGDFELVEMLYGSPPFVLSQLIRTAFIPSDGCRFIVSDFSAIEARVIAWLADESWVLEVFRGHGKIYEATASNMFGVPFETIVKGHANYELRAHGKIATLACGFGGGEKALEVMDSKHEIDPDEYPRLVKQWRDANPNIRKLWYAAEDAAVTAVREKTTVNLAHGVRYRYEAGMLFADLPSGRSLAYVNPRIKPEPKFNKEGLVFDGMDQVKKKWMSHRTYGGRLVENLVQAIARDCLAESMMRVNNEGYKIIMHVHDEVVLDVPVGTGSLEHVTTLMGRPISWAPGLPMRAAGFETEFYCKD